jgi:hypothetical protein
MTFVTAALLCQPSWDHYMRVIVASRNPPIIREISFTMGETRMSLTSFRLIGMTSVLALAATGALADMNFNRIASFATYANNADAMAESSAEIISASGDEIVAFKSTVALDV